MTTTNAGFQELISELGLRYCLLSTNRPKLPRDGYGKSGVVVFVLFLQYLN